MKYLEEIQDQKVTYYYSLPFGQNGLPKTIFKKLFYGGRFEIPVGFSMGILSSGVEQQTSQRNNVPHMTD